MLKNLLVVCAVATASYCFSVAKSDYIDDIRAIAPELGWDKYFESNRWHASYVAAYKAMDDFLSSAVNKQSIHEPIDLSSALELINQRVEQVKPQSSFLNTVHPQNWKHIGRMSKLPLLKEGLGILKELIDNEQECGLAGFATYRKNTQALKTYTHWSTSRGPLVGALVDQFRKYAEFCNDGYLEAFSSTIQNYNHQDNEGVEKFAKSLVKDSISWSDMLDQPDLVKLYIGQTNQILPLFDAQKTLKVIEHIAKDDENVKYLRPVYNEKKDVNYQDSTMFKQLFNDHIRKKCIKYISDLAHVFIPATLNINALKAGYESNSRELLFDFNTKLLVFRICVETVANSNEVTRALFKAARVGAKREGSNIMQ